MLQISSLIHKQLSWFLGRQGHLRRHRDTIPLVLEFVQPLPEITRIVTSQGLEGRVGFHTAGLGGAVTKNHHPVPVVAAKIGTPLEFVGRICLL